MTRPFLKRKVYSCGRREVLEIGRDPRAIVLIDRDPAALDLKVLFATSSIAVRVCPGSHNFLNVDGADGKWHMASGIPAGDLFSRILNTIYDTVVRVPTLAYEPQLELPYSDPEVSDSISSSMRLVASKIRKFAVDSVKLCDPVALEIARRFSPCMRTWVYEAITSDSSRGRLADLAHVCPGTLLFTFACQEVAPLQPVASGLLHDALAGVRLQRLLAHAVADWSAIASDQNIGGTPEMARPWQRIRDVGTKERQRLLADQRLLIRRTRFRTAPVYSILPPPLNFAAEDIPHKIRENARYFRVMKSNVGLISLAETSEETVLLNEFATFCSRNFRVLHPPRHGEIVRGRIRRLIEYVKLSGRHTGRDTNPLRLLAECTRWHGLAGGISALPDTELRNVNSDDWSDARVRVKPLRRVFDLLEEGERMQLCLDKKIQSALDESDFYAVDVDGRPIVVEIRHTVNGRVFVNGMRGFSNREVEEGEILALGPWLKSLGAQ